MTDAQIKKNRDDFFSISQTYIRREGLNRLLHYLENQTDFFQAPSSVRFHLNERGGLCLHSLNVLETSLRIYKSVLEPQQKVGKANFSEPITEESIAIVALFHDVCKTNMYREVEKWRKDEQNRWVSYSAYDVVDEFPFGHGEKSCIIINHYLKLTKEELLAIRWHMGAFEAGEQGSSSRKSFYSACEASPLVALIQSADMLTALCLEKTTKN